jgi:hypothetical protein
MGTFYGCVASCWISTLIASVFEDCGAVMVGSPCNAWGPDSKSFNHDTNIFKKYDYHPISTVDKNSQLVF